MNQRKKKTALFYDIKYVKIYKNRKYPDSAKLL